MIFVLSNVSSEFIQLYHFIFYLYFIYIYIYLFIYYNFLFFFYTRLIIIFIFKLSKLSKISLYLTSISQ